MAKLGHRDILSKLKKRGYRITSVRTALIDFILSQPGHWTIQNLDDEAKKKLPSVGVATLYRTVSLLLEEKLLTETRIGGSSARYEVLTLQHHDHLTCTECGEIFEFENDRIEQLQREIAKKLGFKLSDHRMELYGDCVRPGCKFKPRDSANSVTLRQKAAVKM